MKLNTEYAQITGVLQGSNVGLIWSLLFINDLDALHYGRYENILCDQQYDEYKKFHIKSRINKSKLTLIKKAEENKLWIIYKEVLKLSKWTSIM